jgi:hypothetical protein
MKWKRTKAQIAADKKRTGRPPLGNKAKSVGVFVRMTRTEATVIRAEAKRRGVSVGQLLMDSWRD